VKRWEGEVRGGGGGLRCREVRRGVEGKCSGRERVLVHGKSAAYEYKAEDVMPSSDEGIDAERMPKRPRVKARCLGGCEIIACSFDLCQSKPRRLDIHQATARCSKGSYIVACSFGRNQDAKKRA
jgi:hypothetical protein